MHGTALEVVACVQSVARNWLNESREIRQYLSGALEWWFCQT